MNTTHHYYSRPLLMGTILFFVSGAQAQNRATQKKPSLTAAQRMSQAGPQEISLK